jgi:predicted DNA binding protein
MWIAEIKLRGANSLIGAKAKKFNVSISGYPLTSYREKDEICVYIAGFVSGDERNIKKFFSELKSDVRVINLENNGAFAISLIKEPAKFNVAYSHKFVHIKPIVIDTEGVEHWTVGSWSKEELLSFIDVYEKTHQAELIKIYQENINTFFIISPTPDLSQKQKRAVELAIINGYYEYPRSIEVGQLASIMGLSYSTYHAHLRKAERKLLPYFFGIKETK